MYIDFTLSYNTFNTHIEGLERLYEFSDDYVGVENYFSIIHKVNKQKMNF